MINIDIADFDGVGDIATHCDLPKLETAKQEAIEFDLQPLLCNLFGEIDDRWSETSGTVYDIVQEKTFDNCQNFKTRHPGLKRVLAYFVYARYMLINSYNDTAGGNVSLNNNFSIPKPLKDIKLFSDKYKTMGLESFAKVEAYMLMNREDYPGLNTDKLEHCGCNGSCGKRTKAKGFGLRSRNVSNK